MNKSRLGVDTGGTFTDFVWLDANGRFNIHKQLSTPQDPSLAILSGIQHHAISEQTDVVHGSTVATNALLERRGAKTALITTKGFADVLAIGRQNRPDIYALVPQKPAPLVPAKWRFGVDERVDANGRILHPLSDDNIAVIINAIEADEIESVAVCLLFSFLQPVHEQQIRKAIASRLPHLHVSLSSEILPEYREYERTTTTVINAYVAPLMGHYLKKLAQGVAPRQLTVMQSNGGVISAQTAGHEAARTALSGPAGGVVGARFVAEQADIHHIITFDMGGTSTDVALCPNRLPTTSAGEIADMPLRLPIIDIHTVGAGGGSLAFVDAGDALHVGPKSAGADPGPACYGGLGDNQQLTVNSQQSTDSGERATDNGSWVTVTDANLVLGRLDADHFLGGGMRLDLAAARRELTALAGTMGVDSAETAAWGVIQVANANMERAVRRISIERGYDPRRFTLVPFGGAGPLHACELAQNLQIPRVLTPAVPGVLSALGMLVAAPTKDFSQTVMKQVGEWNAATESWLQAQFAPLLQRALTEMAAEGVAANVLDLRYNLDMRYVGQSHELTIPYRATQGTSLIAAFHGVHETRFGYRQGHAQVEIVTVRLTAVAPVTPPTLSKQPKAGTDATDAVLGEKQVWFKQRPYPTKLYDRKKLQPGNQFTGPAIVFQYDTTVVIPPEWETAVDAFGNLLSTYVE
ncbi:MAG: hydantoinase/oxoprolinase family protein [Chloroflexi bacterium]|nr:hydantoinase/oxoprolinase family protein [Chloroflexota bacterium]